MMNGTIFKRLICLVLVCTFVFSLFSCGFNTNTSTNTNTNTGSNINTNTDTNTGTNGHSKDAFTVKLIYGGKLYVPTEEITVYWTGENGSVHSAIFNEEGIASAEGLDGDYRVTLSHTPEGIAYNPNIYKATNDKRNVEIELREIIKTKGSGSKLYQEIEISGTGVYQATLKSSTHIIYYEFRPHEPGQYVAESWMDITAELYNPYCETYTGQPTGALYPTGIMNGGGAEGVYTKNFYNLVKINHEMIGNVLVFGIRVDAKNVENYPVTLTFEIKKAEEYDVTFNVDGDMYVPKENMSDYWSKTTHQYSKDEYRIVGAEMPIKGRDKAYIYDEKNYRLWDKADGGDGFYHLYNEKNYPETNGYGPILYAQLYTPLQYFESAIATMEAVSGTAVLTIVIDGKKTNFKHFIEGYTKLAMRNESEYNGGSYYCDEYCPCHPKDQQSGLACTADCEKCIDSCRRIKPELIDNECLKRYQNSDGMVAVTQEIKDFLLLFSLKQRYFADGEGNCELIGVTRIVDGKEVHGTIDSDDASQWLFACSYYEKID